VTRLVRRESEGIRKVVGRRNDAPPHWAASQEPRHWNYWLREPLAYATSLPGRLGVGAPRLIDIATVGDDIEIVLEDVAGRHGATLTVDDLEATAEMLGRSQGRPDLPDETWLSRDFLATYSGTRPVDWELMPSAERWAAPLMRAHFSAEIRDALLRMHGNRSRLLKLLAQLPRTVCHLDVWPNNIFRRADGQMVLVDWAFVGEGVVGEDIGNLVPDSVFDLLLPPEVIDVLDARLPSAYLRGLRDAGWDGDERLVHIGIRASGIKYDWLTAFCLEHAETDAHRDYGGGGTVDADARYAARAAGLALCARWSDEALRLASEVGLDA
jgi:hypothetical protein